jgi:hypothetical protein
MLIENDELDHLLDALKPRSGIKYSVSCINGYWLLTTDRFLNGSQPSGKSEDIVRAVSKDINFVISKIPQLEEQAVKLMENRNSATTWEGVISDKWKK